MRKNWTNRNGTGERRESAFSLSLSLATRYASSRWFFAFLAPAPVSMSLLMNPGPLRRGPPAGKAGPRGGPTGNLNRRWLDADRVPRLLSATPSEKSNTINRRSGNVFRRAPRAQKNRTGARERRGEEWMVVSPTSRRINSPPDPPPLPFRSFFFFYLSDFSITGGSLPRYQFLKSSSEKQMHISRFKYFFEARECNSSIFFFAKNCTRITLL